MKQNTKLLTILIISAVLLSSCSAIGIKSTPTPTPVPVVEASGGVVSQGHLVPKDYMYLIIPRRRSYIQCHGEAG